MTNNENYGDHMRFSRQVFTILISTIILPSLVFAFSSGPPDGYANNPPNERNCTSCHSSFNLNSGDGDIELQDLPDRYEPGENYSLTIAFEDPDAERWGFEITVIDENEDGVGEFDISDDRNTQLSEGRNEDPDYVMQTNNGTYRGDEESVTWEFDWTAPDEDVGEITFYLVGNAANDNGNTTGDRIYATTFSLEAEDPPPPPPPSDEFTISLMEGWNLISSPVMPNVTTLDTIFAAAVMNESLILIRNHLHRDYIPGADTLDLTDWNAEQSFYVKAGEEFDVTFVGSFADPDSALMLVNGWNWIAYTRMDTLHTSEAFGVLEDNFILAKKGDGTFFANDYDFNNLGWMYPGDGILVRVAEEVNYVWPDPEMEFDGPEEQPELQHFTDLPNTGRSMNLLVVEWDGIEIDEGDEIGFVNEDGFLCGAAVIQGDTVAATVWGDDFETPDTLDGYDDGELLQVQYWDADEDTIYVIEAICRINCDFIYANDTLIPLTLYKEIEDVVTGGAASNLPTGFELTGAHPNPFNATTEIEFYLGSADKVNIELRDIGGRLMKQLVSANFNAGDHKFAFDAGDIPAGVYFISAHSAGVTSTLRVVLLK